MTNNVTDTEKGQWIKWYFPNEASIAVNNSVQHLKKNGLWLCKGCSRELSGASAISRRMDCGSVRDVPVSYLGHLPKKNGLWLCKGCSRELSGASAKEEWIVALYSTGII